MNIEISCPHKNCREGKHRIKSKLPDICGVLDCTREAKTKIRIGFTFYRVCFCHAQGFEETIMEENYGFEND